MMRFGDASSTCVERRPRGFASFKNERNRTRCGRDGTLPPRYVDAELKLLRALSSGDAIEDHLEPAYFKAFLRARAERAAVS